MNSKILLLVNTGLILGMFFFLDFFGVFSLYGQVKDALWGSTGLILVDKDSPTRNDMLLFAEQEYKKIQESLRVQISELTRLQEEVSKQKEEIEEKSRNLEEQEKSFQNKVEKLRMDEDEKNSYDRRLITLAESLYNMPPERSVERILALKDDILVLDIFAKMDELAKKRGDISVVPYLYSLMPAEDSGRLLRKKAFHIASLEQ